MLIKWDYYKIIHNSVTILIKKLLRCTSYIQIRVKTPSDDIRAISSLVFGPPGLNNF